MPVVRKLSEEEVKTVTRNKVGARRMIEDQYDQLVMEFGPGDYAEVNLDEGDTKPSVRQRINRAMMRRGLEIEWLRGKADTLKFKVAGEPVADDYVEEEGGDQELAALEEYEEEEVAVAPEPAPAPKPVAKRPARKPVTSRAAFTEAP